MLYIKIKGGANMFEQKLIEILKDSKRIMSLEELSKLMHCSISTVKRSKVNVNKTTKNLIRAKPGPRGGYYIQL